MVVFSLHDLRTGDLRHLSVFPRTGRGAATRRFFRIFYTNTRECTDSVDVNDQRGRRFALRQETRRIKRSLACMEGRDGTRGEDQDQKIRAPSAVESFDTMARWLAGRGSAMEGA